MACNGNSLKCFEYDLTFLEYYSGYFLENGVLQEKNERVIEGVWERSDDDVY